VVTNTPTTLPTGPQSTDWKQKLAVALGVAGGVLGLVAIFVVVWWVRKKHRMEGEVCLPFVPLPQTRFEMAIGIGILETFTTGSSSIHG